jgi:hypothetical protein
MGFIRNAVCPECGANIQVNVPETPRKKYDGFDWIRDDWNGTKLRCPSVPRDASCSVLLGWPLDC